MFKLVKDEEIYSEVIMGLIANAEEFVWIGTADVKDLHLKMARGYKPFLSLLSELIEKGVSIRLLHAKEPGPRFRKDFDNYENLKDGLERALCPRVHLKSVIVDGKAAYFGSANLTGAGMGAKHVDKRNFEIGAVSDESSIVSGIMEQFDDIWMGARCASCKRKEFCPDPIA